MLQTLIVSALAAAWALDKRRRPEFRLLWFISTTGDPKDLTPWEPDTTPTVPAGAEWLVRVAIENVGNRAAERVMANFVVAPDINLGVVTSSSDRVMESTNNIAGRAPGFGVSFNAPKVDSVAPGDFAMFEYTIGNAAERNMTPGASGWYPAEQRSRLLFTVSEAQLNAGGRNFMPSILPARAEDEPVAVLAWPPAPMRPRYVRGKLRRIAALPAGRVACSRGSRQDVREVFLAL
jgi:hypothetical protein